MIKYKDIDYFDSFFFFFSVCHHHQDDDDAEPIDTMFFGLVWFVWLLLSGIKSKKTSNGKWKMEISPYSCCWLFNISNFYLLF